GFYNYYQEHNNNNMLTQPNSSIGDNLNYPFVLLAGRLREMGHTVSTIDTENLATYDVIVFIEFPGESNPYLKKLVAKKFQNAYLVLLESPAIKPDNYDIKNHAYFKKIFTWDDNLVDGIRYFKIQYSHLIPPTINFDINKKEKLCTLISSNKSTSHPRELYSQRIGAIRWFEKNQAQDFDLYGKGWDRHNFEGTFLGVKIARLNRLSLLTKLLALDYPSYKGSVTSKKDTYQKYKFAICYENVEGFTGYITEKIMDCFLGGCVPIYLGAPNIGEHIPENTFVDKRRFSTYEALYSYIKNMPDTEYMGYIEAIKHFLTSEKVQPFSAEYLANTIIKQIV
ncbi:MAG: hypothetical protein EXS48_03320, partial [Candidatus Staskawiczbacteria bacterium]|nr:hypothetical protein [Candidatus Staskawiczbacteria bacterium]